MKRVYWKATWSDKEFFSNPVVPKVAEEIANNLSINPSVYDIKIKDAK